LFAWDQVFIKGFIMSGIVLEMGAEKKLKNHRTNLMEFKKEDKECGIKPYKLLKML